MGPCWPRLRARRGRWRQEGRGAPRSPRRRGGGGGQQPHGGAVGAATDARAVAGRGGGRPRGRVGRGGWRWGRRARRSGAVGSRRRPRLAGSGQPAAVAAAPAPAIPRVLNIKGHQMLCISRCWHRSLEKLDLLRRSPDVLRTSSRESRARGPNDSETCRAVRWDMLGPNKPQRMAGSLGRCRNERVVGRSLGNVSEADDWGLVDRHKGVCGA